MKTILIIISACLMAVVIATDLNTDSVARHSIAAIERIKVSDVRVCGPDRDTIRWIENGMEKITVRRGGWWHFDGWKVPERKGKK
jgi:hypothetical protein